MPVNLTFRFEKKKMITIMTTIIINKRRKMNGCGLAPPPLRKLQEIKVKHDIIKRW